MAKKLTTQEFIFRAQEVHKQKYDYSQVTYTGCQKKIKIKCNKCGLTFEQFPTNHLKGQGCPKCGREQASKNRKLTLEEFTEKAHRVHGNKYDYSKVVYINSQDKVTIICPIHGEFQQKATMHLHGNGCPECAKKYQGPMRKSTEEFVQEAQDVHNNKYDYSKTVYTGVKNKVCIICPIHGEFWQVPSSHLRGIGCPKCSASKGELFVEKVLRDLNLSYKSQHYIGIQGSYVLVDFYLKYNNNEYIIEYNGMQHYVPVKHFGGNLKFEQQTKRDSLLRNYCRDHNINLLEIKYDQTQDDIIKSIKTFIKL